MQYWHPDYENPITEDSLREGDSAFQKTVMKIWFLGKFENPAESTLEPKCYRLQLAAECLALIAGFDELICPDASRFQPEAGNGTHRGCPVPPGGEARSGCAG